MRQIEDLPLVSMTMPHYGENVFKLFGGFSREARRSGWSEGEIAMVIAEVKKSDYDNAYRTICKHVSDPRPIL